MKIHWIFRVVSLFNYQGSLRSFSQATSLLYHIVFNLSSTFFKSFLSFSMFAVLSNKLAYLITTRFVCQYLFSSFFKLFELFELFEFFLPFKRFVILSQAFLFVNYFFKIFFKSFYCWILVFFVLFCRELSKARLILTLKFILVNTYF